MGFLWWILEVLLEVAGFSGVAGRSQATTSCLSSRSSLNRLIRGLRGCRVFLWRAGALLERSHGHRDSALRFFKGIQKGLHLGPGDRDLALRPSENAAGQARLHLVGVRWTSTWRSTFGAPPVKCSALDVFHKSFALLSEALHGSVGPVLSREREMHHRRSIHLP